MPADIAVEDKILIRLIVTKYRNPMRSVFFLALHKCFERISTRIPNVLSSRIAMKLACVGAVMQPYHFLPRAVTWRSLTQLPHH